MLLESLSPPSLSSPLVFAPPSSLFLETMNSLLGGSAAIQARLPGSDKSSSGASYASARETTPDSSDSLLQTASFSLGPNLTDTDRTPLPPTAPNWVDMNHSYPFESVNTRRNKLSTGGGGGPQGTGLAGGPRPPTRGGGRTCQTSGVPRCLATNWRLTPAMAAPTVVTNSGNALALRGGGPAYIGRGIAAEESYLRVPELPSVDGPYAYCLPRGDGTYTRLIPADMLPPLRDIPAVQQSAAGMVVLQALEGTPPAGQPGNNSPVALKVGYPDFVSREFQPRLRPVQNPPQPMPLSDPIQVKLS